MYYVYVSAISVDALLQSGHIAAFDQLFTIQQLSNSSFTATRATSPPRHAPPSSAAGELPAPAATPSPVTQTRQPTHNGVVFFTGGRLLSGSRS